MTEPKSTLNWHRIFFSFGACAWLYAPVAPDVLHDKTETNGNDGWTTALCSIKQLEKAAKHQ